MKSGADFLIRRAPDFCLLIYIAAATVGAFNGGMWAGLGIGFAAIMLAAVWRIEGRTPLPPVEILAFILLALGGFAILNLQSSQPALSWRMWEQLATIFVPLGFLANADIQKRAASARLFVVLPMAAAAGALALGTELALQGPLLKWMHGPAAGLFQYDRGFSYLVILAFPAMACLRVTKRAWLIVPFVLILFLPAGLTQLRAAKLALMMGLLATLGAYFLPRVTRGMLTAAPFVATGWPFAAQKLFLGRHDWIERLPPSWQDRTEIWDYMSYRILERPFLGWGLGSSSKLPFAMPHGALYHYELANASHPHNAIIQLWVELGLPGLALGIGFALFMLRRAGRLPSAVMPFACGAWVAAFCLAMISYNLWSDSLWAAMALAGFAFALLAAERPDVRG